MKVLHVAYAFPPYNMAGVEVYTHSLCRELSKRHEVFVVHRVNDAKKREYEVTRKQENNLIAFSLNDSFKYCYSFRQLYNNEKITAAFARLLDEVKPDIVHIQHLIFLSTDIIEEIKKRSIPIVFRLHDYWLICPNGISFAIIRHCVCVIMMKTRHSRICFGNRNSIFQI